jgi:hypothetical protein
LPPRPSGTSPASQRRRADACRGRGPRRRASRPPTPRQALCSPARATRMSASSTRNRWDALLRLAGSKMDTSRIPGATRRPSRCEMPNSPALSAPVWLHCAPQRSEVQYRSDGEDAQKRCLAGASRERWTGHAARPRARAALPVGGRFRDRTKTLRYSRAHVVRLRLAALAFWLAQSPPSRGPGDAPSPHLQRLLSVGSVGAGTSFSGSSARVGVFVSGHGSPRLTA